MARMQFGGETADVYLHEDELGDLQAYGPLVAKFFDGFDESASPVLDLLDAAGEPVSLVQVAGSEEGLRKGQLPLIWGPDEVYELWVSVNNSPRQLMRPVNVGSTLSPTKEAVDELLSGVDPNPFDTALTDLLDVDQQGVLAAPEGSTLIKAPGGLYIAGSSPIPLSDIIWVAASDAPANFQGAPYVCDGVDDQEEINEALSNSFGLKVGLSPGNFNVSDPIRLHWLTNPALAAQTPSSQYLIGSGQTVTKINVPTGVASGIYIYDNVSPHIWDLTISVVNQRGIWAFRPGGAAIDYRSMFNGSIQRVTIAGPSAGTHLEWGMSLKSADNILLEDVTMTGTKYGMEIVSESTEQILQNITFRNCRVTIVNDGGQCFRTGNDAGTIRGVTFDTCAALVANTAQATTEGFRISANNGQTYGVKLINCTSQGLNVAIHNWPNATDVDADFALVEPRQGGMFAHAEGGASKFAVSEFRIIPSVTTATMMNDSAPASLANQYWHHSYTMGASTITGASQGTGIIRRGIHEGSGTIASNLLRNRNQLIDRAYTKPVVITNVATIGAAGTDWSTAEAKIRTSADGKIVYGKMRMTRTGAALTPVSNNPPDSTMFTLNAAYRPIEAFHFLWSTGLATGSGVIGTNGTLTMTTGNQAIATNATVVFSFYFIKD